MNVSTSLLGGHRDHPTLGIATFVGNLMLMTLLSAAVRELVNREYPLSEVLLLRYLFASLFFWLILFSTTGLAGLATRRPLDHAIRSVSGVVSLGLLYFAITRIPIADATALAYAAPIFITVLSIFLLGEEIGLRGYALERLQNSYSPLKASLIIGFWWGLWHLPAWTNRAVLEIIIVWLGVTAFSVIFTWFYNNTMSLPIVMLFHAALNSFDDVYENIFPHLIEIDWELPYVVGILLLGLASSLYLHKKVERNLIRLKDE